MPLTGRSVTLALALAAFLACDAAVAVADEVEARNVSTQSGISGDGLTYSATIADWDGNGQDDALIGRHYEMFPRLMLNQDGVFTDVSPSAFVGAPNRRDFHGCAAADADLNGHLDLYCTNGGGKGGNGSRSNHLWLQQPNGTFEARTGEWGAKDEYGRGRGAAFVDANGDPYPDLYVSNQYPRKDGRISRNRLFINEDGQRFRSAGEFGINKQMGGESLTEAVDFDADGREDLMVCGQRGLILYRNIGERRFVNASRARRVKRSCQDTVVADMNGDGRPDLVNALAGRIQVFLQAPDGRVRLRPAFTERVKRTRALAAGDVNLDGTPDIYVLRSDSFNPRVPNDQQTDIRDVMLVSRGGPRSFGRQRIPQFLDGWGDEVTALDHDANGLTDFIVMNGRRKASGPIRLVGFFPADP